MLRFAVLAFLTVAAAQALAARSSPAPASGSWPSWEPAEGSWAPAADEAPDYGGQVYDEPSQEPDPFEAVMIQMNPSTYIPAAVSPDQAQANLRAVLDAIAWCEGTAGPDGYRTMFGYRYFDSYADHPRQYFPFTNNAGQQLYSSASGRYQIIVKTWDSLRARLGLADFSPPNQDAAAVELIRERGALQDAYAGRMEAVARKCRMVWASLPGSNVAQNTRSLSQVLAAYQAAGGALA